MSFIWIAIVAISAALFYKYLVKGQLYWYSQGISQTFPVPLLGDNWRSLFMYQSLMDFYKQVYYRDPSSRYVGTYFLTLPQLIVKDPDLIKQMTIKDFDSFTERRSIIQSKGRDHMLAKSLFLLKGPEWRNMRPLLSPTFTSNKMKSMFGLMNECGKQYVDFYLEKQKKQIEVNLKDSLSRYLNDVIANCIFGISCDSLKEPNNPFYLNTKMFTRDSELLTYLKLLLNACAPNIAYVLNINIFPKSFVEFFIETVKKTIKYRVENNIHRPDMLHLMMEVRKGKLEYDEDASTSKSTGFATVEESSFGTIKSKKRNYEMTDEEIAAQMATFFAAGFDTTSNATMLMAYELGLNPDVQEKLLKEIDAMRASKTQLEYDDLAKMEYLDMVVSETLRKHSAQQIDRMCTKPYTIEPKNPGEKPVHLKVGQRVLFPINVMHNDPAHFSNPDHFDPERFSKENKSKIKPYTYIPFGIGPRNCIGSRMSLVAMKVFLYHLLSNFTIEVTRDTCIPLKHSKMSLFKNIKGGIWMAYERRDHN